MTAEFKLVPVEPTEEMNKEGMRWLTGFQHMRANDKRNALSESFKAMLSAAATPPQPIYDEAKERELFEATYDHPREKDGEGNYVYGIDRAAWAGWLACARSRAKAGEVK